MADKDTVTKDYMSDNATFADLFNFYIYDGHEVIVPEQLKPLDTTEIALPYSNEHLIAIQKLRDVMKLYAAMSDDKATYLLLGVENQSELHYAMPIKNVKSYEDPDIVALNDEKCISIRRDGLYLFSFEEGPENAKKVMDLEYYGGGY